MARARTSAIAVTEDPALTAAATPIALDGTSWRAFKLGDQRWQEEAWRHYDICGELRYASNWLANAVSRCRLYVAEVDKRGRPGEETKDAEVQMLAESMFGGPAMKAEAQRLLGIGLYVPGESYIVAEDVASASKDIWYVCSTSEVHRDGTEGISVDRSNLYGGGRVKLRKGKDLLIRCWTPHPRRYDAADSSVRAVLPVLREIEQLTKKVFAEIDSRLAGAGMVFVPEEMSFPAGPKDPPGVGGLAAKMIRAAQQSLQDQSSASALVPLFVTAPGELLDKVKHITFATPMQAETLTKLDNAIRRLGLGLDIPPEVLLGQGDTNHWSAWQIEESTIKIQVEPILVRICQALTEGYLQAALKIAGKDPEKYVVWYDAAALAVRPNREADARELNAMGVVSDETVRTEGNWGDEAAPDDEERARKLAEKLVLAQPALISNKDIQKALGVDWEIQDPNAAPDQGLGPDEFGPPGEDNGRALPQFPADETPAQEAALLIGADFIVRRALERAGARLLTRARKASGQFTSTPALEVHLQVAIPAEEAPRLLDGAFVSVPDLAGRVGMEAPVLEDMLTVYTTALLVRNQPHDYEGFCTYVDQALELIGHQRCGQFCRNPLHPGPCKGWRHQMDVAPADRRDHTPDRTRQRDRNRAIREQRRSQRQQTTTSPPAKKAPAKRASESARHALPSGERGNDGFEPATEGRNLGEPDRLEQVSRSMQSLMQDWSRAERERIDALSQNMNEGWPRTDAELPPGPPNNGYQGNAAMAAQQGFDGLPLVATEGDLDRAVQAGGVEFWRGVGDGWGGFDQRFSQQGQSTTGEQMIEQLRTGTAYWGYGVYGNGIYGGDDQIVSREYAAGTRFGYPTGGPATRNGAVVRMVLRPGARVIEYDDAKTARQEWIRRMRDVPAQRRMTPSERSDWDTHIQRTSTDLGVWAAMMGYDAIYADEAQYVRSEGDNSRHWNILNRTAVLVSEHTEVVERGVTRTPEGASQRRRRY